MFQMHPVLALGGPLAQNQSVERGFFYRRERMFQSGTTKRKILLFLKKNKQKALCLAGAPHRDY
jgi:hypothetical protein